VCLRLQAALERGFVFTDSVNVCPGVDKSDVTFRREDRFAKGWIVEIQLALELEVDPAMADYNFHTSASTKELAEKFGRAHIPLPGKTIPGARDSLSQEDKNRVVLIGPATQGGFWGANTVVIKDGRLIKKTAPGLYQTEVMEPDSDFYFLILDPGKTEIRKITLINGVPQEDISDIKLAFVGPPLFYHGEDLSGQIRFPKTPDGKPAPLISGYDVNWDPQKTITSFILWGCNRKTGVIYYFPMVRTGDKPIDGVLCTELPEAFRQYAAERGIDMNDVDLILGPGGVDVNVILGDEELISTTDPRSATAKDYPPGERPVGTRVYALKYDNVETDQINREESDRRIAILKQEIEERVRNRGGQAVSGQEAVAEVEWLLNRVYDPGNPNGSNCSDPGFRANMPDHMKEMPGIIKMLNPNASPELLIASMLHDGDRFFDGYYVWIKDEPPLGGPWYLNYYKPVQHPRMAADFVRPLLELLGIDEDIIKKVDVLIRNHEIGIEKNTAAMREAQRRFSPPELQGLITASNTVRDADSVSVFTPVLFMNAFVDLRDKGREREFYHEIYEKYTRPSPEARRIIDELTKDRRGEYLAIPGGKAAYDVFRRVQDDARKQEEYKLGRLLAQAI
jgi:hypothetical protein